MRKDFGSRKARCYNRLKEIIFRVIEGIFRTENTVGTLCDFGKPLVPTNTVIKEDHLVRNIE